MRNLVTMAVVATCLAALTASAGEDGKKGPTPEQKEFRQKMVAKYDTNGDGKLDKEERAKISDADRQKMKEMGGQGGGGKKAKHADE